MAQTAWPTDADVPVDIEAVVPDIQPEDTPPLCPWCCTDDDFHERWCRFGGE